MNITILVLVVGEQHKAVMHQATWVSDRDSINDNSPDPTKTLWGRVDMHAFVAVMVCFRLVKQMKLLVMSLDDITEMIPLCTGVGDNKM